MNGINYYRIKTNEKDGRFENSRIVNTKNQLQTGPHILTNPVTSLLQIAGIEKGCRIILYNAYGAQIINTESKNNYVNIHIANIANGTYFIKLISKTGIEVLPVIIRN